MVAEVFNLRTWEEEAGRCLSWRPDWSSEFQNSHGYSEKPYLKKSNIQTKDYCSSKPLSDFKILK